MNLNIIPGARHTFNLQIEPTGTDISKTTNQDQLLPTTWVKLVDLLVAGIRTNMVQEQITENTGDLKNVEKFLNFCEKYHPAEIICKVLVTSSMLIRKEDAVGLPRSFVTMTYRIQNESNGDVPYEYKVRLLGDTPEELYNILQTIFETVKNHPNIRTVRNRVAQPRFNNHQDYSGAKNRELPADFEQRVDEIVRRVMQNPNTDEAKIVQRAIGEFSYWINTSLAKLGENLTREFIEARARRDLMNRLRYDESQNLNNKPPKPVENQPSTESDS